jgi:amino acid transporter
MSDNYLLLALASIVCVVSFLFLFITKFLVRKTKKHEELGNRELATCYLFGSSAGLALTVVAMLVWVSMAIGYVFSSPTYSLSPTDGKANPPEFVMIVDKIVNGNEVKLGELDLLSRHGIATVYLWVDWKGLPEKEQQRIATEVWQAINKAKVRIDLSPETKELISQSAEPSIEDKGN